MSNTSTEAIVLKKIKYKENRLIVHLFTKDYGRIAGITTLSKKRKMANYFQPLYHLSFEVNYNEKKTLHPLQQVRFSAPYTHIPFSVKKHTVAQFLAEILGKVLAENEPDQELFRFFTNAIHLYDQINDNIRPFHLLFLIHLTRFLGFYPGRKTSSNDFFSPSEGTFVPQIMHDTMPDNLSSIFENILNVPFSKFNEISITGRAQSELLDKVLEFYKIHLNLSNLKSYSILKQVFQ